jgi:hypothetical protein
MYIMGNAGNLAARSDMWRNVLEELDAKDCVGNALPIFCHQHKDAVKYVSKPGELSRIAPDGIPKSISDEALPDLSLFPLRWMPKTM